MKFCLALKICRSHAECYMLDCVNTGNIPCNSRSQPSIQYICVLYLELEATTNHKLVMMKTPLDLIDSTGWRLISDTIFNDYTY